MRLVLSYKPLDDLLVGRIGEPGLAHLLPLFDGVTVQVRRDDPEDLVGFEIEGFAEGFGRLDSGRLSSFLGVDVVDELREAWSQVREDQPQRSEVLHDLLSPAQFDLADGTPRVIELE